AMAGHGHALYDSLTHVPLVLRPPGGLDEARRVDALASHVDLLPTFADLLGLDLRQPQEDRYSLAPWLGSEAPDSERPYALLGANHIGQAQRGLRSARHKLILHDDPRLRPELFDLEQDPREQQNLAPNAPTLRDEMTEVLELAYGVLQRAEPGEAVELDAETREQLRALGYLD
ncbi:MAG: sulfatase/phosphatase domain-containing protein, partial [Acidobacteriota bacterium]